MIDLNQGELQGNGGSGPIPEDSIIAFTMTIRTPKAGKEGSTHAMFSRSSKGNEYIDVEFEALGSYAGRKIWQNFTLVGSEQAAKISMRTLRAIVESARGISPSDASPAATAGRQLSDWLDFNSMTFLAKVGTVVEQSQKDGQFYVNNTLKRIITPDDSEYAGGEWISDKPLPAVPEAGTPEPIPAIPPTTGRAGASWGSGAAVATPAPAPAGPAAAAKPAGGPVPDWAKR